MPGDGLRSLNWRAASFLSALAIMISSVSMQYKRRGATEAAPACWYGYALCCGLGSGLDALVGSSLESCLGLDSEGSEARGVVGGDVCEDLAIQLIAGELEAVDEGGVAHAVVAAGCVDADDPEGAVLALLLFAAGVGELERALDGLLSSLVELGFGEEVTTGALEDLLAAVVAFCTPFYTGHLASPFAYIV